MPDRIAAQQALHTLFHPRAVAVIGASDDTTKHGYIVLNNVREAGFAGGIYGISRRLKQVNGIPCLPDLASLPEPVDVAFLAIPAEAAVQAVRDCAQAGLTAAIVGSAGYAESLEVAGAERQAELAQIAVEAGIRIVGPNCNGIYNAHLPLSIGFNTSHAKRQPPGGISIFSHSGALFDAMAGRLAYARRGAVAVRLRRQRGRPVRARLHGIRDQPCADARDRAADQFAGRWRTLPSPGVAGRRCRQARGGVEDRRIGGGRACGGGAFVAHRRRQRGICALFEASGVATVASLEGFMTAAALLDRYGRRPGGLGAMSTSGAGASLLADRCAALGVPLAALSSDTPSASTATGCSRGSATLSTSGYSAACGVRPRCRALLANDPGVGVALALVHSMNPWQGDPIRAALANARETSGKPLLIVAPGGMPDTERAWYETRGMTVFGETDILLEAIGAMLTPLAAAMPECPVTATPPLPHRMLTEPESLRLLREFGVPVVDTIECATPEAALAAAEHVGWPVVLKGVAEGVAHKTERGLVRVNLRDPAALRAAYAALGTPRVIVQPMVSAALEAIAGISRSPGVGAVLAAGLGGIHAEALREVCLWPVPVPRGRSWPSWRQAVWDACWPVRAGNIPPRRAISSSYCSRCRTLPLLSAIGWRQWTSIR